MDKIDKPNTNNGNNAIATVNSTAIEAIMAERGRAEIEARYIVAQKNPREWATVRLSLKEACERPGFAGSATERIEGAAWYKKPLGKGNIEGFTVRFAEEARRCMGHIDVQKNIIYDDHANRIVSVKVTDLQNNLTEEEVVTVEKTVERSSLKKGQSSLSVRTNSFGNTVYIIQATDDEVVKKQNNLVSRAFRNAMLRLVPGDIQAECRERILQIRNGDIAKDPKAFQRRITDSFGEIGVSPNDLKLYLGHAIGASSQAELGALRDLYKEIRDGNTTFHEVVTAVLQERDGVVDAEFEETEKSKSKSQKLTEKLKKESEEK